MALITTFVPGTAGTAPTYGSAASGDTCECSAGQSTTHYLIVKNGSGASITCTITGQKPLESGATYPDKVYTVAAGGEAWIPLLNVWRNATTLVASLTWSATASVTRAVVRTG